MFETSTLTQTKKEEEAEKKEEEVEDEEEEKLEPDVKESVSQNSLFEKVFQRQILKLRTFKGVGKEDRQPSKKDEGFLSIEKLKKEGDNTHFIAYRNYLGNT